MKKIELAKDIRNMIVEDIKKFYWEEREEHIGDLPAEILLDYILDNIGPHIYNQAIGDAYAFISEKAEDLFGLEKRFR